MKISIYGKGCQKCKMLEENARKAADDLKIKAEFEKITDFEKIADAGVMMTPAIAINGKVISQGKILLSEEIKAYLK